mgnify:CR=1 FL=1
MPIEITVRAHGDYYAPVEGAPPDVRELSKQTLGKQVRRVGRFIQLALIGAARCVGTQTPPAHTGIYMSSRRGDLETNLEVLEQFFKHGHTPKPLNFINTVSNASCYYVARHFGLHGRSCFVTGVCFSFEMALQAALLDMQAGVVRSALVGGLDTVAAPLEIDRRRLGLNAQTPVSEASHWLWLEARAPAPGGTTLEAVEAFADRDALAAWLKRQSFAPEKTLLAEGQYLAPADARALRGETALTRAFAYRESLAYYDGQAGAALGAYRATADLDGTALAHINGDAEGRFAAIVARRSA